MPFKFKKTNIPDILFIEARTFSDNRGLFMEVFKASDFKEYGIENNFVQVNQSHSKRNVIRGLHYQLKPKMQAKLVHVIKGEIFDVAVDIRKNSPSFGKWVGEVLSGPRMLYIPEGFAHGFCVLSDVAEVIYQCSCEYSKEHERGILWSDTDISIDWPIKNPILSDKDAQLPTLKKATLD